MLLLDYNNHYTCVRYLSWSLSNFLSTNLLSIVTIALAVDNTKALRFERRWSLTVHNKSSSVLSILMKRARRSLHNLGRVCKTRLLEEEERGY